MGFNIRIVCESLVKIYEEGDSASSLRAPTHERPCEKHMLESKKSHAKLDFMSHFVA